MIRLTHIVNPVKVSNSTDLYVAQPVTFESMRRAKEYSDGQVDVRLVATCYPEDEEIVPDYFDKTAFLPRSVLDVGTFKTKRKLPLISDILERALEYDPTADYIIYTNVDIALQPYFYQFVNKQINMGFDAFVINRRTIPSTYSLETLDLAYSEIGKKHPGFDCFVFPAKFVSQMNLDHIGIGISKIGISLLINLIKLSNNFKIFSDEHLTFHIGEDKVWQNPDLMDYHKYNCEIAYAIYKDFIDKDPKLLEWELIAKHFILLQREVKGISVPKQSKQSKQSKPGLRQLLHFGKKRTT